MIPRFFCPAGDDPAESLAAGRVVTAPDSVAHHALKVLRLHNGDPLILFDGRGGEYVGCIVEAGRTLRVRLDEWREVDREPPLPVTLVQALPGSDKMDWIVQKAVELGVAVIQPVQAKRSVVRLSGERAEKRVAHWQQVAISACEQSGRNRVPEIREILDLGHYLAQSPADNETRMLLSPHEGVSLSTLPRPSGPLMLLIGPEGGFEEGEEAAARSVGFQGMRLGPRVLRTETAGLAALAAIMAVWGDF